MKRLEATISGRVQGVGFREFVRHEAATRGITGYVRNSDDGRRVEVVAEAEESLLEELLATLQRGPRFARVEHVEVGMSDAGKGFTRFSVEL